VSSKYKFIDSKGVYFTTSTVAGWIDVFTRDIYRDILLDSIRYCQKNKGLKIHAWVLMPNHLHLICSFAEGFDGGRVLRDMKSFTAMKLIDAIINNPQESRCQWMLDTFEKEGLHSSSNQRYMFWQHENHPFLLENTFLYDQKLNYLHENPVRAGFVSEAGHWKYSSAPDYFATGQGLLDIISLE
jgi:putative transposase